MPYDALWNGFGPTDMRRIALIAALEREVAPFAKGLRRRKQAYEGMVAFESDYLLMVCGGIGTARAAAATSWAIATLKPEVVMSVGFAGALTASCKVADVITPGTVIDGGTGEIFAVRAARGVLVTESAVAATGGKRDLALLYGADAVDMEAAAVARVAQENGVPFFAAKVISDAVDFAMPPLQQFVSEAGKFQTPEFLAHVAVRPALWPAVARLGANSRKASSQLCNWLENQMRRDFQHILEGVSGNARV
jgi:adenosylhomocysteine nucleosidase